MATDYSPIYADGDAITRTTSAAVSAGNVLIVSGSDTVSKSEGVSAAYLGVAAFDAASGAEVTVLSEGVHQLAASGTINAGDLVTTAASGAVAAFSGTTYSTIIGIALSDAANSLVVVKLFR